MSNFGPHEKIGFTVSERLHYDKLVAKMAAIDDDLRHAIASKITDPVVLQTGWSPVDRRGANFRTFELVPIDAGRVEFRATSFAKGFGTAFVAMGLGTAILYSVQNFSKGDFFGIRTVMLYLFAAAFAAAGWYMRFRMTLPAVFDIDEGLFWKQTPGRDDASGEEAKKDVTHLEDIHALQIVPSYHAGDSNSSGYYSYELNLVLEDGKRISVVNSGDRNGLSRDAQTLSNFIGKPIWDATEYAFEFYAAHQIDHPTAAPPAAVRDQRSPAPRNKAAWAGRLLMTVLFAGFLVIGLVAVAQTTQRLHRNYGLVHSGLAASGKVIDYKQTTGKDGRIWPVVTFVTSDGRSVTFESLYHPRYSGYSMGQAVPVLYDRRDPQLAEINEPERLWGGMVFYYVVGVLFAGIGGGGLFVVLRRS